MDEEKTAIDGMPDDDMSVDSISADDMSADEEDIVVEPEKKQKEHKGLKLFMPLLAGLYGLIISVLGGLFIMFDNSLEQQLKANAVEAIAVVVTFFLAVKLMPKMFPEMKNYSFKRPDWRILLAIALCTPLYIAIKYRLIYYIAGLWTTFDLELMIYDAEELKSDLLASVSAVILAPIYEELCFRFIPVSIYRKKATRIVVGIIMAFMFAWLHGDNWVAVTVDAVVYCTLFLVTKNVWTNIVAHSCNNLFVTVLAILTFYGAKIQMYEDVPMVMLLPWGMTLVYAILAAAGIAVFICDRKRRRTV